MEYNNEGREIVIESSISQQPEIQTNYQNESMTLTFLKSFTGWATFKAIVDIITGALACFGIITAAYGIPQIISGVRLLNAVDELKRYMISNNQERITFALYNLNRYFKISGISIIIKTGFIVLFIVLYTVIILAFVTNAGNTGNFNPDFYFN